MLWVRVPTTIHNMMIGLSRNDRRLYSFWLLLRRVKSISCSRIGLRMEYSCTQNILLYYSFNVSSLLANFAKYICVVQQRDRMVIGWCAGIIKCYIEIFFTKQCNAMWWNWTFFFVNILWLLDGFFEGGCTCFLVLIDAPTLNRLYFICSVFSI